MDPSLTGTLTSPASSPAESVWIVSAETGCTDNANPVPSEVITNPRRVHCIRGSNTSNSLSIVSTVSSLANAFSSHERSNFRPRRIFGKGRSPKSDRSVIVVVVDTDAGAARLTGLPADRQMRAHLDLHRDLARRRRDALADPDRDPRRDVFSGAQRGATRRAAAGRPGVQGAGRQPGRARAEFEPIEPEPATQAVENTRPAACEGGGRGSELQPFARGDLADPAVEQHTREYLVLRHDRRRTQCNRWRRGKTADIDLRGDIGGARLGDDVEDRVELGAAVKGDRAAGQREGL